MSMGTKNRLALVATLCRDHLRQNHSDQADLVEEFIAEIQASSEDNAWLQFTDAKRSDAEMRDRVDQAFQAWLNGE